MPDLSFSELINEGHARAASGQPFHWHYETALDALRYLANAGMADECIKAAILVYNELVKPTETEETAQHFYAQSGPILEALAQMTPKSAPATGDGIAFVLSSGYRLGHSDILAQVMQYAPENVHVIVLNEPSDNLRQAFGDTPLIACGKRGTYVQRVEWLREELTARKCGTCVWVSGGNLVNYAFARRIAARQIYWAHRFHIGVNHADDNFSIWGTRSDRGRVIDGRTWQTVTPPWPKFCVRASDEEVRAERARIEDRYVSGTTLSGAWSSGPFIFGTISRVEKVAVPEFLSAVIRILQAVPTAMFVYTGPWDYPAIQEPLKAAGVWNQCASIGWCEHHVTLPAFDCFLEPFPIGGITTASAMDYGVPAVFMTGIVGICGMTDEGEGVETVDEYVDRAVSLAGDPEQRRITLDYQSRFAKRQHAMAESDCLRLFERIAGPSHMGLERGVVREAA